MHKHLQLVREFHHKYGISQPDYPDTAHLSDAEIVLRLSLLMECGSETCKAIAKGDLEQILAGLVDLAYNALAAIACRGDDVIPVSVNWRQDGSVLSVARVLSEKINSCTSGETLHYSGLYSQCQYLSKFFLNADFDKAFQLIHTNIMQRDGIDDRKPDLSAAFYE